MNNKHFTEVKNIALGKSLGDIKAIRSFMLKKTKDEISEKTFSNELLEAIDFSVSVLGEPLKIFCKTVNYEKTIIILEHKDKKTSHISLNLFNNSVEELFKIEVVGDLGILEYDSTKNKVLVVNNGNHKVNSTISKSIDKSYDSKVYDVVDKIISKIKNDN